MKKFKIIALLLFICSIVTSYICCSLERTPFKPLIQASNPQLEIWRLDAQLESPSDIARKDSSICITHRISENNHQIRCFQYALQKTIGFTDPISFLDKPNSILIEDFYEQTNDPHPNDLAIYTPNAADCTIKHFSIVLSQVTFESKWGSHEEIVQHAPFNVPLNYGDAIWFFTLKPEYRNREYLHKSIKNAIVHRQNEIKISQEKHAKELSSLLGSS